MERSQSTWPKMNRIFLRYTAMYSAVLLAVFFSLAALFQYVYWEFRDEAISTTQVQMRQIVDRLDEVLRQVRRNAVAIRLDKSVSVQAFARSDSSAEVGIRTLGEMKFDNPIIDRVFVQYGGSLWSDMGLTSAHTFLGTTLGIKQEDLTPLIDAIYAGEQRIMSVSGANDRIVFVLYPLKEAGSSVGFALNAAYLQKQLSWIVRDYDCCAILRLEDGSIASLLAGALPDGTEQKFVDSILSEKPPLDGYTFLSCSSDVFGYHLLFTINTNQIFEHVLNVRTFYLACLGTTFFISLLTVFFINRYNTKPVIQISNMIQQSEHHAKLNCNANEMDVIRTALEYYSSELDRRIMTANDFQIEISNLAKTLVFHGFSGDESFVRKLYGMLNIPDDIHGFAVCCLMAEHNQEQNDLNALVAQHSDRLIQQSDCVRGQNALALLFCLPDADMARIRRDDHINELLSILRGEGIEAWACVGTVYSNLNGIRHSYSEAFACAANSLDLHSAGGVYYFEQLVRMESINSCFTPRDMQLYREALASRSLSDVVRAFDAVFHSMITIALPQDAFRFLCYQIVMTTLDELHKSCSECARQTDLISCVLLDADGFREYMLRFLNSYCKSSDAPTPIGDIIYYIETHYADANMSLQALSSYFRMSISALSKSIKSGMGVTYIDYISSLRMKEARRLLAETDMNIQLIIQRIGYNDPASFSRKFKTMFNMTPGEYRNACERQKMQ